MDAFTIRFVRNILKLPSKIIVNTQYNVFIRDQTWVETMYLQIK